MLIVNQRYEFLPPGESVPVIVTGMQEYSPGQTKRSDIWRLEASDTLSHLVPTETEFRSFGEVQRELARIFCSGDVSKVSSALKAV